MLQLPVRTWLLIAGALVTLQATVLFYMGQPAICACGYVKVWEGAVLSIGNSQHLFDWYTFSHIIHGFLFYLILKLLLPRMPIAQRLVLSLGIEISWEIVENTPWVINHYREQALAQGYTGDSVINSVFDTLAMIVGFVLAWRLPVWTVVALGVGMEIFVGYSIRDNLALNVVNLIHQFDVIRVWQSG